MTPKERGKPKMVVAYIGEDNALFECLLWSNTVRYHSEQDLPHGLVKESDLA